jgi:H+/Cl- antiporter ClcA
VLLAFGALIGAPVAATAYFFLKGVTELQQYLFVTLARDAGFESQPAWWPIPLLALSGLLVALTIRYLPGMAGHKPAEGFKSSGPVSPRELPGIIIASFVTLGLGVVLGPEAPLIAIGSGLGVLAVRSVKISGDAATAQVHSTAANQPPSDDTISLARLHGTWYIAGTVSTGPQPAAP